MTHCHIQKVNKGRSESIGCYLVITQKTQVGS